MTYKSVHLKPYESCDSKKSTDYPIIDDVLHSGVKDRKVYGKSAIQLTLARNLFRSDLCK